MRNTRLQQLFDQAYNREDLTAKQLTAISTILEAADTASSMGNPYFISTDEQSAAMGVAYESAFWPVINQHFGWGVA